MTMTTQNLPLSADQLKGIVIVGYRYGQAPANGKSTNYRDNCLEAGVSMAGVGYLPEVNTMAVWDCSNRKRYYYIGTIAGLGGDDEICLAHVKQLTYKEYCEARKTRVMVEASNTIAKIFCAIKTGHWTDQHVARVEASIRSAKKDAAETNDLIADYVAQDRDLRDFAQLIVKAEQGQDIVTIDVTTCKVVGSGIIAGDDNMAVVLPASLKIGQTIYDETAIFNGDEHCDIINEDGQLYAISARGIYELKQA